MRQILLFAALAASLALLSGCALSKAKEDKAEDMTGKAAYHICRFPVRFRSLLPSIQRKQFC